MTSATAPKTIDLGGMCIRREGVAAAAITPGHLVGVDANGEISKSHVLDGQEGAPAFALEYDLTGMGIDDDYADGDQVLYGIFPNGSKLYALIADGEDIAVGDKLASNGDGTLKEAGATDFVVAEAREAVVTSGAVARCIVEVAAGRGIA